MHKVSFAICTAVMLTSGCASTPTKPSIQLTKTVEEPTPVRQPPATLTYLGVAGWSLQSGAHTMLFDPYVTRVAVDTEMDNVVVPDGLAIERYIPARADLIVVSHSHFDHALDVPEIALRTGAVVFGTSSTAELARASHVPEQQIVAASGGEELVFTAFKVRAVKALHSLIDMPNLPIAAGPKLPMRARDYQEGGTLQYFVRFGDRTLYFLGTANFVEAQLAGVKADIAIVAVGYRQKVPDYTCRLMRALGFPKLVLPNHFDAWQEPLRPGQMTLSEETQADLSAFEAEVHACAPEAHVITPVWLEPIAL
jgi:L-ascorbate metabolism protein UlaG (beta-lactamase superfamily)